MRTVFVGTPSFAVPILTALLDGAAQVVAVVCQPDRPKGRGQKLHAPPVKVVAERAGVVVAQPLKLKDPDFLAMVRGWAPEIGIVAAYGRILPRALLDIPKRGFINVHASLLPRYRGAAPIQWALLDGEARTGITIMQMNERLDEGDILLQVETAIGAGETHDGLEERLADIGAQALVEALQRLAQGALPATPQDHSQATFAPMIRAAQGEIDWRAPAAVIARQVRAFYAWPSAFTWWNGKRLKLLGVRADARRGDAAPGVVLALGDAVQVASGDGVLCITELQMEGRRAMPAQAFARGAGIRVGDRLGRDRGE